MSEPEYSDLLYKVEKQVATIAINRPSRLNAFTGHTMKEIIAALDRAALDREVGVIVLTGVGEKASTGLTRSRPRCGLDRGSSSKN
jgi:2-ketocyclohexanecarboxyl-CoA hydrolase